MQHKQILDHLPLAVMLVDKGLRLKYLNPAAEEIIGTGACHAMDRPLSDFVLDPKGQLPQHIQASMRSGHSMTQREACMRRIVGGDITIDCSITPVLATDQQATCLLGIIQPGRMVRISREEQLLTEAHATQNMLRGLAHEIKNPLSGIRGAAQLLADELEQHTFHEYTDVIINETNRLRKLVDRMFGPNTAPVKRRLNIHDVLEHIRHLVLAESSAGIQLHSDYDPSIPDISANRDLLIQAILNIVRNAVRAVQQGGHITLKTRVLRRHTIGETVHRLVLEVSVIDDGLGICEALKPQIFFPMVSGSEDSTGLGLSIAQNLISLHAGLIEFDSVSGHTEFRVLLPVNDETETHGGGLP